MSTPLSAKEARLKKILEEELVDPDKLMNKNKKQSRSMYDSNAKIVSKKGRSSYNTLDLRTTENLGKIIFTYFYHYHHDYFHHRHHHHSIV